MSGRILVTGAGSGLGRAIAARYAEKGWRVLVTDVDGAAAERAAGELGGGGRVAWQGLDVRADGDWEAARAWCRETWGGLDLLVNNAGVAAGGRFERIPMEDWDWILDVNLKGVVRGCRTFVPLFQEQGAGHLVNVASLAGLLNPPAMASYDVVKAAVISLSEALRHELEPQGIRTTVACPSFFRTGLAASLRTPDPEVRRLVERLVSASSTPPERIAAEIERGVARGRFLVLTDRDGRVAYGAKRLAPPLFRRQMRRGTRRLLARLEGGPR